MAPFLWTKMGAESGEALERILRRKDLERQIGGGVFAWGIGSALGQAPNERSLDSPGLEVLFSPMLSRARKEDASPSAVVLWTAYAAADGRSRPLPEHVLVTSRAHAAGAEKTRHYALLCHSDAPVDAGPLAGLEIAPATLRNWGTGGVLGASQVTALVESAGGAPSGRTYSVAFRAQLIPRGYVRLAEPRILPAADLAAMDSAAQAGAAQWAELVRHLRRIASPPAIDS